MQRLKTVLGHSWAAAGILAAILTPFLLMQLFTSGVAATGVRVDPMYTGGEEVRTIERGPYRIAVSRVAAPIGPLQRGEPYVQLAWSPAEALPQFVSDEVDIDGDGKPDLVARFAVPRDPARRLRADVISKNPRIRELRNLGADSFSSLIVRAGNRIVLRVPVRR
jgi:hypothetical protein